MTMNENDKQAFKDWYKQQIWGNASWEDGVFEGFEFGLEYRDKQAKPVAWMSDWQDGSNVDFTTKPFVAATWVENDYPIQPLYTYPPQPVQTVKPVAFNGWYCAQCQRGVAPSEVTYHETHTECGRYITDDEPPAQPVQPAVAQSWEPIETAPKDNKRALYLARFNESGELVGLDFNGAWEYWQESWELAHINGYAWVSENGIEEPTHWAYQDLPLPKSLSAPAGAQGEPVAINPIQKRRVFDYIRGAYDLGYNDARDAKAVPGDSAPGYQGRSVEKDHGEALIHAINCTNNAPAAAINEQLYTALEGLLAIARDSQGVAGYHLNGVVAKWDEFEEISAAEDAIAEAEKAKGGAV